MGSTGLVLKPPTSDQNLPEYNSGSELPEIAVEETQPVYSDICVDREEDLDNSRTDSGYLPDFGLVGPDSDIVSPDSGGLGPDSDTVELDESSSQRGGACQSAAFLPDFSQLGNSGGLRHLELDRLDSIEKSVSETRDLLQELNFFD